MEKTDKQSGSGGLQLHRVLQEFRQTEDQKAALAHKITVLQMHHAANTKKARNIHRSLARLHRTQQHLQDQKQQIALSLAVQREAHELRVARDRQHRQDSKENLQVMRNLVAQEKQAECRAVRERTRINQLAITQNLKRSLHEKRQRSLEVKLAEQQSRLNQTVFLETKRLRAHQTAQHELLPLQLGLSLNARDINELRRLEEDVLAKLTRSRQNLADSKLSLTRVAHRPNDWRSP